MNGAVVTTDCDSLLRASSRCSPNGQKNHTQACELLRRIQNAKGELTNGVDGPGIIDSE